MKPITTLLLLTLSASASQIIIPNDDPFAAPATIQGFQINASGAKPQTAQQQRDNLLKKLVIDRTPASILKTRIQLQKTPKLNEDIPPLDLEELKKLDQQKQDQTKLEQLKKQIALIKTDVTLGNWSRLKKTLASLPKNEASQLYSTILSSLNRRINVTQPSTQHTPGRNSSGSNRQIQYFPPSEILPLTEASPTPLTEQHLKQLAQLIGKKNLPSPAFYENLKGTHTHLGSSTPLSSKNTANLLINAGLLLQAKPYLPDQQKALKENNVELIDLLARYHTDSNKQKSGNEHIQTAWELSQAVLSNKKATARYRASALYRALQLIPKLDEGKSAEWLKKTFTGKDSEGYEILSTIAMVSSQTRTTTDASTRLQDIKLQYSAANALIANAPENLSEWSEILTFFIINWNHEAQYSFTHDTSTSLTPQVQTDYYGNIFYNDPFNNQRSQYLQIKPIPSGELLSLAPSETWLEQTHLNTQLEYLTLASKLYLKVKEEQKAFPLLKKIVQNRPNQAEELIRELINVWAQNNNPNAQNDRYRSRYSYMYGYNQRAESIPLTRSKQERNLKNLSKLITEIRALKLPASFEKEFSNAFVAAHSTAEVWRLNTLQTVFGATEELEPDTVASLVSKMRTNLITLWPSKKVQQDAKTKRTDKELQAQIIKGYDLAQTLLKQASTNHPNNWKLNLQQAALIQERSNYQSEIDSNKEHSANKTEALKLFEKTAQQYIASLPLEKRSEETAEPFSIWFAAALGAPDIKALKSEQQPTASEYPKIKAALESISDPATAKRHQDSFAKAVNTRLASVKPDLKLRYLYAALPIIGENPLATDARAIAEYYRDLITEIELDTHLAGPSNISADKPFGLHINLHHTREIERESGGFQRYLINQNASGGYNYGRPTEDYRDKFEKSLRSTLSENFEIVSVTFHNSKVASRTSERDGWTITPYAYALLKPKGAQIDTIPPLKIDLDFLDTSGHVIIPITSAAIPISADTPDASSPHRDLKITQILDDRTQDKENQITLEIKATAHGLTPDLEDIVNFPPTGFKVVNIDDRKLQIQTLDAETSDLAPISNHEWKVTLESENEELPSEFTFPEIKLPLAKEQGLTLQKYDDVDLISVEQTTSLTKAEQAPLKTWLYILVTVILAIIATIFIRKNRRPAPQAQEQKLIPPADLTPVTLLAYLEKLKTNSSLNSEQKEKISQEIQTLQTASFSNNPTPPTKENLRKIVQNWERTA